MKTFETFGQLAVAHVSTGTPVRITSPNYVEGVIEATGEGLTIASGNIFVPRFDSQESVISRRITLLEDAFSSGTTSRINRYERSADGAWVADATGLTSCIYYAGQIWEPDVEIAFTAGGYPVTSWSVSGDTISVVTSALGTVTFSLYDGREFLPLSGGTMTGDLIMRKQNPRVDLRTSTGSDSTLGLVDSTSLNGTLFRYDGGNNVFRLLSVNTGALNTIFSYDTHAPSAVTYNRDLAISKPDAQLRLEGGAGGNSSIRLTENSDAQGMDVQYNGATNQTEFRTRTGSISTSAFTIGVSATSAFTYSRDIIILKDNPGMRLRTLNNTIATLALTEASGNNGGSFRYNASSGLISLVGLNGGVASDVMSVSRSAGSGLNVFRDQIISKSNPVITLQGTSGSVTSIIRLLDVMSSGLQINYLATSNAIEHRTFNLGVQTVYASVDNRTGIETRSAALRVQQPSNAADATPRDYVDARLPVGSILMWPVGSVPAGYLQLDGQSFNAATYSDLNALLGGNTLPDMRGEFARGWDNGRGVDPGRNIRTAQDHALGSHQHATTNDARAIPSRAGTDSIIDGSSGSSSTNDADYNGSQVTGFFGGTETRPRNVSLMFIIRAL